MSSGVVFAVLAALAAAGALVELATAAHEERGRRDALAQARADARARRRAQVAATLARVGRRAGLPVPAAADLQVRLHSAGLGDRLAVGELTAMKIGAGLIAALAIAPVALIFGPRTGPLLLVAAGAAGFLGPDGWLRRQATRRRRQARLEIADVFDLLRVAAEAGCAPQTALKRIGRLHKGLVAQELAQVTDRIDLGVPRHEAYERLRHRLPLAPIVALTHALERADRHGAPLNAALRALAADARAEQSRALLENAAKAAPKIQLVVALILVPAVLLLVAATLLDTAS